jgi:hypothetical protein
MPLGVENILFCFKRYIEKIYDIWYNITRFRLFADDPKSEKGRVYRYGNN